MSSNNDEYQCGIVRWFLESKGIGFIQKSNVGSDIFIDHTTIEKSGYKVLVEGQKVEFIEKNGSRGPEAERIRIVS
ncbi:cold-shock protein [Fluviispira sanaruensis]|uniref:Cold-shock protein n=1 Tax=Fluviispira sanaruensis TaxID=2493639 RepID=A0A4P2VHC8_FLUSA|nr:cold shock domain-containing protein [Fluviispira sanaruensis]BBH52296.1 cold-shock protein [Fluviispira sanaruensis]